MIEEYDENCFLPSELNIHSFVEYGLEFIGKWYTYMQRTFYFGYQ